MSTTNHQPQPDPTDPTEDPPTVTEPLVYTVAEAADVLRISRRSLYGLFGSGELRSITIGARRLVASADLHDYIVTRREVTP
jgi:excisionase family DNA binding protein